MIIELYLKTHKHTHTHTYIDLIFDSLKDSHCVKLLVFQNIQNTISNINEWMNETVSGKHQKHKSN